MKQPRYKPAICRNCGKTFTYHNPKGTKRVGGRPAVYCSDKCREEWRAKYKRRLAQKQRRGENRRLQQQGIEHYIVDYKRDRELEQVILNLELHPELIKKLHFKINYFDIPHSEDDFKVSWCLDKAVELKLDTEYLKNNTPWNLEELDLEY